MDKKELLQFLKGERYTLIRDINRKVDIYKREYARCGGVTNRRFETEEKHIRSMEDRVKQYTYFIEELEKEIGE